VPRLAQGDLTELRLRLRSSEIRSEVTKRLSLDDVANALDEIEECWAGNLPEWAGLDSRSECADWDNELGPPPAAHVRAIEELAERSLAKARLLADQNRCATPEEWKHFVEDLFTVLEDIEGDQESHAEGGEEQGCADDSFACELGTRCSTCGHERDPG